MAVKFALLALLARTPQSTYQLRKAFDAATSASWPLNIGQVSTTLSRLERDGLVARAAEPDGAPWQLTTAGEQALAAWWHAPVARLAAGRDELVIKLAIAAATGHNVTQLIQRQRTATHQTLHDVTAVRRAAASDDFAGILVLDHHLFMLEAEMRWLDDVEATLIRQRRRVAKTARRAVVQRSSTSQPEEVR